MNLSAWLSNLHVPAAARPPIRCFPAHKAIKRDRLICSRESHPSRYYSMLQDDRVTLEGDQVMSRGDPEVGQL